MNRLSPRMQPTWFLLLLSLSSIHIISTHSNAPSSKSPSPCGVLPSRYAFFFYVIFAKNLDQVDIVNFRAEMRWLVKMKLYTKMNWPVYRGRDLEDDWGSVRNLEMSRLDLLGSNDPI